MLLFDPVANVLDKVSPHGRRLVQRTLVIILSLVAIYGLAGRLMVYYVIPTYQDKILEQISSLIQADIQVDKVETSWSYLGPQIRVSNLRILNPAGEPALQAESLSGYYNPFWSFVTLSLDPWTLAVDKLEIHLAQDDKGAIRLKGMPRRQNAFNPDPIIDFLQQSRSLSLRQGAIWLEAAAPELQAERLRFDVSGRILNNYWTSRWIDLRMSGHDSLDCPNSCDIRLQAAFTGDPRNIDSLNGSLRIKAADLVLEHWVSLWSPLAPLITGLESFQAGGLDAELAINDGQLENARFSLSVAAGKWQGETPLSLNASNLSLTLARKHANAWAFHIPEVSGFSNGTPFSLTDASLLLLWDHVTDRLNKIWLTLEGIDAKPLIDVLLATPALTSGQDNLVQQLETQTHLSDVQMVIERPPAERWRLGLHARFQDVSVTGYREIPALNGVSGTLLLSEVGGEIQIDPDRPFSLEFPLDFDSPFVMDSARGKIQFRILPGNVYILGKGLQAQLPTGQALGNFFLHLPSNPENAILFLHIGILNTNITTVRSFIPLRIPASARDWTLEALESGDFPGAGIVYMHHLRQHEGMARSVLELNASGRDVQLKFDAAWPPVEHLDVDVAITRAEIRARILSGTLAGTPLLRGSATIKSGDTTVQLHGEGDSSAADLQQLARSTPLRDIVPDEVLHWQAEGAVNVEAQIQLPLDANQAPHSSLKLRPQGIRLKVPSADLTFEDLRGAIHIDSLDGVNSGPVTANIMGGSATLQFHSDWQKSAHPDVRVQVQGRMGFQNLADWLKTPYINVIQGSARYEGDLLISGAADSSLRLDMKSDLVGAQIPLPAPFFKEASEPREANIALQVTADKNIRLQMRIAPDIESEMLFSNGGFIGGETLIAETRKPSAKYARDGSMRIKGAITQTDVGEWLSFLGLLEQIERESGLESEPGSESGAPFLDRVLVSGEKLSFGAFETSAFSLSLAANPENWDINVESPEIKGSFLFQNDSSEISTVSLDHLKIPLTPTPETPGTPLPDPLAVPDPPAVPDPLAAVEFSDLVPLDVHIRELQVGDQSYGKNWSFRVSPETDRVTLTNLKADLHGLRLQSTDTKSDAGATVTWWETNEGRRTSFKGALRGKNLAAVLRRWQMPDEGHAEEVDLSAELSWLGSPVAYNLHSIDGEINVALKDGYLSSVKKGSNIMKLIGLIDPLALPKRLTGQFSDLTGKGLTFSRLRGAAALRSGVVETLKPIVITGPGNELQAGGTVNLLTKELQGELVVILPVAKNLPLYAAYAALFANPFTGAGIWLAQALLRKQIRKFTSIKYRISGTADAPSLEFSSLFNDTITSGGATEGDSSDASDDPPSLE